MPDDLVSRSHENGTPQPKFTLLHWAGKEGKLTLGPSFAWMIVALASIATGVKVSLSIMGAFACGTVLTLSGRWLWSRMQKMKRQK